MNTTSEPDTSCEHDHNAVEPVPKQREQQSKENPPIGTIIEAGRDKQFIFSSTDMVHKRPPLQTSDGYALDPVCGQTLPDGSVWGGIDADTGEEVARKYGKVKFCSKCFTRSLHLSQLGRKARRDL